MSSHASTALADDHDPIEQINLRFRSLYGANRDELFAQTPLAGLTLIGTGELWRIEYGRVVKSYPPTAWLPKVKGLMHAIIGAEGTWARLARGKDLDAARNAAEQLNCALREAVSRVPNELPRELAGPAEIILRELLRLSDGWSSGRETTSREFPEALARVQAELTQVIDIVGEGVYASITKGLREFIDESDADPVGSVHCLCMRRRLRPSRQRRNRCGHGADGARDGWNAASLSRKRAYGRRGSEMPVGGDRRPRTRSKCLWRSLSHVARHFGGCRVPTCRRRVFPELGPQP